MSAIEWLRIRAVELGASLCTAAILIGGLAVGVPSLRARIPEVFLYSFCCVRAVVLRAGIDLAVRLVLLGARASARGHTLISPRSRSPARVRRRPPPGHPRT